MLIRSFAFRCKFIENYSLLLLGYLLQQLSTFVPSLRNRFPQLCILSVGFSGQLVFEILFENLHLLQKALAFILIKSPFDALPHHFTLCLNLTSFDLVLVFNFFKY